MTKELTKSTSQVSNPLQKRDLLSEIYNLPSIKAILEDTDKSKQLNLASSFKLDLIYLAKMQGVDIEKIDNHLLLGIYEVVTRKYQRLSPVEIRRAFEMAYSGKLNLSDKDLECYGTVKVTYVTKILDAYVKFRDVEKYKIKEEIEKANDLTPIQKMDLSIFTAKRVILSSYIAYKYKLETELEHHSARLIVQYWHYDLLKAMNCITVSDSARIRIYENQKKLYTANGDLSNIRDIPMDKAKVITVIKQFDLWHNKGVTTKDLKDSFRELSREFYVKILTNR